MLPIIGIVNALLINVFMLRVSYIAAILKCETKEEELRTDRRIAIIKIVYLPSYFILRVLILLTQYAVFSDPDYNQWTLACSIIVFNVLKECLTGTLGIFVLIFAYRL